MNDLICRIAKEQAPWDQTVQRNTMPDEFLQSWMWGEFQSAAGRSVVRYEILRGKDRLAQCLVVLHRVKLGRSYLLAPRGPIMVRNLPADLSIQVWNVLLNTIQREREPSAMFLKMEPNVSPPARVEVQPGTGVHPERTLVLELQKSEEDLLKDMHPKTRYNINLARRKGVMVHWGREPKDVDAFLQLLHATAIHQHIGVFRDEYYRQMVASLGQSIEVAVASIDTKQVAAALMVRFGKTYAYVHGASAPEQRSFMAPHLMQWESIRRAKSDGYLLYDFFGIAPEQAVNHKWAGITRFKLGFGGNIHQYLGALNVVYQRSWYLAYRFTKRIAGQ